MRKLIFTMGLRKLFYFLLAMLACGLMILSPFWALQWYRQPFIGAFIETNNIVSQITGKDWPARQAGLPHLSRLLKANGSPITTPNSLNQIVNQAGSGPIELTYELRDGSIHTLTFNSRPVTLNELITYFVIPYIIALTFLLCGLWVYWLSNKNEQACAFLLFTISSSLAIALLLDVNTTRHATLVWSLSLPVIGGAMFSLALVFPKRLPLVQKIPVLALVPWLATLVLEIPSAWQIISPTDPWAYILPWAHSYNFFTFGLILFISMLLIRIWKSTSPVERQQSRIIVFGAGLAFTPITISFLIPVVLGINSPFNAIVSFPPTILLPISVSYAILRHRLFDIERALNRFVTYALTIFGLLIIFYLMITLFSFFVDEQIRADDPMVVAAYTLVLVISLNPLLNLTKQGIDRFFYRDRRDFRRVLLSLAQDLTVTPDLDHNLQLLEGSLQEALNPDRFLLFLFDENQSRYLPYSSLSYTGTPLFLDNPLIRILQETGAAIWLPADRPLPPEMVPAGKIAATMACRAFVPIQFESRLVGVLALGGKVSGEPYSREDLEFLSAVAGQSALAVTISQLFEAERRHRQELEQQVADQTRDLTTLFKVTAVASDSLELQTILERVLDEVVRSMICCMGTIHLVDRVNNQLGLTAHWGISDEQARQLEILPLEKRLLANVSKGAKIAFSTPADTETSRAINPLALFQKVCDCEAFFGEPIQAKDEILGLLTLGTEADRRFAGDEASLLSSIADRIGVAVENARLYQQAQQVAVLEERQRLAREMHDSVTQLLYSTNLYAEAARRLAEAGDFNKALLNIKALGQTAQQALKEARLLVYQLRPSALEQRGLVEALQHRLEAVEKRTGVIPNLIVEGEASELSPKIEEVLYQISQEALNNALKHAEANTITLHLYVQDRLVGLEVTDDGVGFEVDKAWGKGGIGLLSMRERAEKSGGALHVFSETGKGTRVRVEIEAGPASNPIHDQTFLVR